MATGEMSSKVAVMLSPGMTISVPWGSVTEPAGRQRFVNSLQARHPRGTVVQFSSFTHFCVSSQAH